MNKELLQQILGELKEIKTTQGSMHSQLEEHGQILRALEYNTNVIKAEQENMKHDVANLSGNLKSVAEDVTGLSDSVNTLTKDFSTIEFVTGKNMSDIAMLKAVR